MTIVTEGRIFIARMMREARAREKLGAGLLCPGALTWRDAITGFGKRMEKAKGPVHGGKLFASALEGLTRAHQERACYVNYFARRKRSGMFQVFTQEVDKHPINPSRLDGIVIGAYSVRLQRGGYLTAVGHLAAFVSWHALGRLYERSELDTIDASKIVGLIGIAAHLVRRSEKHRGTSLSVVFEDEVMAVGVLRENGKHAFYDVLTVLPGDRDFLAVHRAQAGHVAGAVKRYLASETADPAGYADLIPVIPFKHEDYVTRKLQQKAIKARKKVPDNMEVR